MTPLVFLLTAFGGGLGAVLRFAVDTGVTRLAGGRFPWGILVVNTTGSFLLGMLTGAAPPQELLFVLGAGVLGGYTTFSTAMVDTVRLGARRAFGRAFANAAGTLLVTVVAAAGGLLVGRLM